MKRLVILCALSIVSLAFAGQSTNVALPPNHYEFTHKSTDNHHQMDPSTCDPESCCANNASGSMPWYEMVTTYTLINGKTIQEVDYGCGYADHGVPTIQGMLVCTGGTAHGDTGLKPGDTDHLTFCRDGNGKWLGDVYFVYVNKKN